MRVYLDNCCFNRPFDDQRQIRVRLEAEATLCIVDCIRRGVFELVWSYMLDFENAANPFDERRTAISGWRQYATIDVEETPLILQQANKLADAGLKAKDALHIACDSRVMSVFRDDGRPPPQASARYTGYCDYRSNRVCPGE